MVIKNNFDKCIKLDKKINQNLSKAIVEFRCPGEYEIKFKVRKKEYIDGFIYSLEAIVGKYEEKGNIIIKRSSAYLVDIIKITEPHYKVIWEINNTVLSTLTSEYIEHIIIKDSGKREYIFRSYIIKS